MITEKMIQQVVYEGGINNLIKVLDKSNLSFEDLMENSRETLRTLFFKQWRTEGLKFFIENKYNVASYELITKEAIRRKDYSFLEYLLQNASTLRKRKIVRYARGISSTPKSNKDWYSNRFNAVNFKELILMPENDRDTTLLILKNSVQRDEIYSQHEDLKTTEYYYSFDNWLNLLREKDFEMARALYNANSINWGKQSLKKTVTEEFISNNKVEEAILLATVRPIATVRLKKWLFESENLEIVETLLKSDLDLTKNTKFIEQQRKHKWSLDKIKLLFSNESVINGFNEAPTTLFGHILTSMDIKDIVNILTPEAKKVLSECKFTDYTVCKKVAEHADIMPQETLDYVANLSLRKSLEITQILLNGNHISEKVYSEFSQNMITSNWKDYLSLAPLYYDLCKRGIIKDEKVLEISLKGLSSIQLDDEFLIKILDSNDFSKELLMVQSLVQIFSKKTVLSDKVKKELFETARRNGITASMIYRTGIDKKNRWEKDDSKRFNQFIQIHDSGFTASELTDDDFNFFLNQGNQCISQLMIAYGFRPRTDVNLINALKESNFTIMNTLIPHIVNVTKVKQSVNSMRGDKRKIMKQFLASHGHNI